MKKVIIIAQITVGLFFLANTTIAQEVAKPIQAIPEAVLQKRTEPSYTAPANNQNNEAAIKVNIALQAKAQAKTEQKNNMVTPKEEIPQPLVLPTDAMQPTPSSTIDTKLNTDKYYTHKPILPVEPSSQTVNKQIIKAKPTQTKPIVVVE